VDVGCGSGAWAIEVAEQFPGAKVVGMDLSPIQPIDVPQNCEFVVGDLNEGLEFDSGSMDLVQGRYVCTFKPLTQDSHVRTHPGTMAFIR
jgi:ubiquinone/menaquinone biosynthesis C-methylase UbiE